MTSDARLETKLSQHKMIADENKYTTFENCISARFSISTYDYETGQYSVHFPKSILCAFPQQSCKVYIYTTTNKVTVLQKEVSTCNISKKIFTFSIQVFSQLFFFKTNIRNTLNVVITMRTVFSVRR